ncbi:S-layer homology domain-containing protein [Cohnella cholangitidis]|uniref:S-layer homology domain-containing protein n=1 Tax=Cohnella cholangitidis TaxID=2598458 RepID=A0A7G5BYB3_9BACL|nr:S-layer homology domain-containing protein [Cohnella cholangitidis]QMV41947.1 S-layer homology domain-containing protein [Cohnella cholangitidis]
MNNKKVKITRYAVSSAMLVNALAAPVAVFAANESQSPDMAQAAIKELIDKAIMSGDENGDLNLEGKLTRAQVAGILARSLNLDTSKLPSSIFKDVSSDHWGLKYISIMDNLGVMTGANGSFRPNAILTKEELAVILVRITQTNIVGKGKNLQINDAHEVSDWAKGYVQAAIEAGFIPVQNGNFAPKSQVNRKEVAVLTAAFMKSEKFDQYKDEINKLLEEGKKISNSDPAA